MTLENKLVDISSEHHGLLAAAALEGCDFTPQVPDARRMVGYGLTQYGYGPACVLDLTGTEYVLEPHVVWFPWTTTRNKIVNFKWAMNLLAENHEVLLNVSKENAAFFDHFTRIKFLRKAGVLTNMPIVHEIHMYQVIRRKHNE